MWPTREHTRMKFYYMNSMFLLIAIGASPVLDRLPNVSGRGHPAHHNLSEKLYNSGDHDTTPRVLLPAES